MASKVFLLTNSLIKFLNCNELYFGFYYVLQLINNLNFVFNAIAFNSFFLDVFNSRGRVALTRFFNLTEIKTL